jgi:hypothetical protein
MKEIKTQEMVVVNVGETKLSSMLKFKLSNERLLGKQNNRKTLRKFILLT